MRRVVLLSGAAAFVMAFTGNILANSLAVPMLAQAQQSSIRGEQVAVVGANGADRITLSTGPGVRAGVVVLTPEGNRPRLVMSAGGPPSLGGTVPEWAAFNVLASDGTEIARLGTLTGSTPEVIGAHLDLNDLQGTNRVRLASGPDFASGVQVMGADGTVRLQIGTGGGPTGPYRAGFDVHSVDGTRVARLGTGRGPLGDQPLSTDLLLFDWEGNPRVRLRIAEDGTPSIRLLDAEGNVTWSAP